MNLENELREAAQKLVKEPSPDNTKRAKLAIEAIEKSGPTRRNVDDLVFDLRMLAFCADHHINGAAIYLMLTNVKDALEVLKAEENG